MNTLIRYALISSLIIISGCGFEKEIDVMKSIKTAQDIVGLFPQNPQELKKDVASTIETAQKAINDIIVISDDQRTFENTARALDTIYDRLSRLGGILSTVMNTNPDAMMRTSAQAGLIERSNFVIDNLMYNKCLFKAFEDYVTRKSVHENLNDEERYFLTETMANAKKIGIFLPDQEQAHVKTLVKELNKLELDFENNINASLKEILVPQAELAGLSPEAINALKTKTVDGVTYRVIDTSYPILTNVLEHCRVESTRKKAWTEFVNRAYPANEKVLQDIIRLRDELAHALHYTTYAHYDIDLMMAQNPENVKKFLKGIEPRGIKKAKLEFKEFVRNLPDDVTLTSPEHSIKPWDFAYIKSMYKKKNYKLDTRYIAEFFPVESTLANMFKIYETLLGLSFEKVPVTGLWDKDVTAIAIRSVQDKTIRGYLLLDLFPRPNKYTHACFGGLTPSLKKADGTFIPGSGIVIANFPHATPTQPALLKHDDVVTFFHEFGHAMHWILGATEMASCAGTSVKDDFVETPSQMFEEWMWNPAVIKSISRHYKTGDHLSDALIETMVKLKNFDSGMFVTRQLALANMSLDYFSGPKKDLQKIMFAYHRTLQPFVKLMPENHFYAAFGHLSASNYGSKYYNYLWSKFYALDLFETIKERNGLLNSEVGKKLTETILGRGGSRPPQDLLRDFLGREPHSDAFFKNVGM